MIEFIPVQKKDYTYGLYNVFFQNFPSLLQRYINSGQISKRTYLAVRKHMLYTLAGGWIGLLRYEPGARLGNQDDYMQKIFEDYKGESYFKSFLVWSFFNCTLKAYVKKTYVGKLLIKLKHGFREL